MVGIWVILMKLPYQRLHRQILTRPRMEHLPAVQLLSLRFQVSTVLAMLIHQAAAVLYRSIMLMEMAAEVKPLLYATHYYRLQAVQRN